MHQVLLASALAAVSGLFGTTQPSTCSSGQCGMTAYAPAPQVVYQPAPQVAAPVYQAAPTMVQAPQAVPVAPQYQYQPVYQAPGTPLVYYYLPGSTCANGTCARR